MSTDAWDTAVAEHYRLLVEMEILIQQAKRIAP